MSNKSITASITHVAEAAALIERSLSELSEARRNASRALAALKSANAYVSDANSEATAKRLETANRADGVAHVAWELQGILENVRDHLSSLRAERDEPGAQF